ncbi:MAG: integrase catalytic domain-containing protein, partial [Ignavibacteriae bacterium]|nr:integrase catalytic domain-containing protein [Ignavibacteriota bacterium]
YLNEQELQTLINLDLSKQKQLDRIRDLFIVGCYTGLRFSDFSQLRPEHIMGNTIRIKTQKTDHWVTIPLFNPVKDIIEKYKDTPHVLPKSVTNQTMNRRLKDLGELAGMDQDMLKIRNSGKKRIEDVQPKFQFISTHTARRSFATNMFKRGIPSRVIMQITGHKTEKAFSTYIKISQEENAALMLKYYNESA